MDDYFGCLSMSSLVLERFTRSHAHCWLCRSSMAFWQNSLSVVLNVPYIPHTAAQMHFVTYKFDHVALLLKTLCGFCRLQDKIKIN